MSQLTRNGSKKWICQLLNNRSREKSDAEEKNQVYVKIFCDWRIARILNCTMRSKPQNIDTMDIEEISSRTSVAVPGWKHHLQFVVKLTWDVIIVLG